MEQTDGYEVGFRVRCYAKSELAALYMPEVDKRSALKTFKRWMQRNEQLMEVLYRSGYRENDKVFSPIQVKAIVSTLGPP